MKDRQRNAVPAANEALDLSAFRQAPTDSGVSLDQLSAALGEMLDSGADPYAAGDIAHESATGGGPQEAVCEVRPRTILESLLFVGLPGNESLSSTRVAAIMRGVRPAEIDDLVAELNRDYEDRNCPYTIVADGAGYRLALRERFHRVRDKFLGKARQARLSQAAIEILAVVAYRGPIAADEIFRLRGTPGSHLLAQLVRRGLIRLERTTAEPRKTQYTMAPRALELFGLESLQDLPRGSDLEGA